MQVDNNANVSFGINFIRFQDDISKQVFETKNKKISAANFEKMMEEIKNIKPKTGPDVDVYIGSILPNTKDKMNHITYTEPNGKIRKGCVQINGEFHTVEKIKEAFQKLMNQVDEYRLKGI